jgi:uncharacterized 2Fe-2S/4Fe-4S cluster protein (DUF4445 family)
LQVEGQGAEIGLDPVVVAVDMRIQPPDLVDLRSDATRLKAALSDRGYPQAHLGLPVLADLSERLRAQNWQATLALRGSEVVSVLPVGSSLFGLAVDVGTTKLAAYLVDLASGETASKTGAMNPQIAYGEDVVSRIAYANEHVDGRVLLQRRLVDTLNEMLADLRDQAKVGRDQVVEAVVVGNTVMHHLFAGLPVQPLGAAPYVPAVSEPLEFLAGQVGLELAPGAYVYLPPNIAGYVGADHVAMLLATEAAQVFTRQLGRTVVALDIGTNTEISLFHQGRVYSCSCASGPAFEGAHIRDGMRAAPGAIERVRIAGEQVQIYTIEGAPPVGICGSGILDTIAELLSAGLLDGRGVLNGDHPRLRRNDARPIFVLASAETTGHGREVLVARSDVNEIQLAKGAIRTGVEILLAEAGIRDEDIQDFIVAGAFGTYLDLGSAIQIGMFPDIPRQRYQQVGNAAGSGARQMLVSASQRLLAAEIVRQVNYVELTTHPAFTGEYVKALSFKPL